MGAGVRDYRSLVPRTPPEGLREWTLKTCRSELDRSGLVYEVAWVRDNGLLQILDEWAVPKKIKMVRVTCSCCGGSTLLNWAKDEKHGYGFVLPEDEEGNWAHTAAGDEADCPICGEKVLVNKASAIRDYYVSAECHVMSADVINQGSPQSRTSGSVGKGGTREQSGLCDDAGELVLTGWTVQRRVYKSGMENLKFIPSEAYVFTASDCFQLMGWRNGYSGMCGYFIQYGPWRQPKKWSEQWGWEDSVFGLTPELIDRSCLPHCKLDVYMAPYPGAKHYPVAYLRLYQQHPNVESVLLHGLPRVLYDLIADKAGADDWEKNKQGRMDLPEIDWAQTRPAQMLGLTKEELRMGRDQDWGTLFWNLFVGTKRAGELLTAEDIRDAFRLGDENVSMLIPRGQVGKSIRYLLHQCMVLAEEVDGEDADSIPDAQLLTDYWTMSEALGRDLADPSVKYPEDLLAAHDRASDLMRQKAGEAMAELFRIRRRVLKKYAFISNGLLIRPAASQRELTEEGDALHHCVGTYGKHHAKGETAIFFIRRTARPREPYFTLELDEKKLIVRQNRGNRNCARTPEVEAFEREWLAWVRAGAPRDRNGRPLRGEQGARKAGQGKGAAA